jgi:DNA-binding NarL/FixJ family response regulator
MEMNDSVIHLLLVEDNEFDAMVIQKVLSNHDTIDFHICHVTSLQDAQYHSVTNNYDIVLLDLSLPDSFGLESLEKLTPFSLNTPIIILSGIDDEELTLQAVKEGAQDFLIKGMIDKALLPQYIRFALERHHHLQESSNPYLIDEMTGMYNERGFTFLAQQLFKLAKRTGLQFNFFYIELMNLEDISKEFTYDEVHLAVNAAARLVKRTFDPLDLTGHTKLNKFSIIALDNGDLTAEQLTKMFYENADQFQKNHKYPFEINFNVGLVDFDPEQFTLFESLFKKTESKVKHTINNSI